MIVQIGSNVYRSFICLIAADIFQTFFRTHSSRDFLPHVKKVKFIKFDSEVNVKFIVKLIVKSM